MDAVWVDALNDFADAELRSGRAATTIALRCKTVRRFAGWLRDRSPWHVTTREVDAWVESLRVTCGTTTVSVLRGGLRAFYRWAVEAGRMRDDPTEYDAWRAVRLGVPELWEPELVAYERYLWSKGAAPSTVRATLEQLRTFAREMGARHPFAITLDDLYEWMAGKRWARETRRARKSAMRGFYGWAVDTERMPVDPSERMPVVKASDPVARPVTDAEYAAALRNAGDDSVRLALRLAADMGLRRAEVAQVHTADIVQRDDGSVWLTVTGKGSKVRHLPLPSELHAMLRARRPGYVFPGRVIDRHAHAASEGHVSPRWMGKRIGATLPPGVTMHALRHRFATRAYNVDRDVFTVQRMLGHASAATTQRYVQVSDERMRALMSAVSGSA